MTHLIINVHVQLSKALCDVQLAGLLQPSCLARVWDLLICCSLDPREGFSSLVLHKQIHSDVRLWVTSRRQEAPPQTQAQHRLTRCTSAGFYC